MSQASSADKLLLIIQYSFPNQIIVVVFFFDILPNKQSSIFDRIYRLFVSFCCYCCWDFCCGCCCCCCCCSCCGCCCHQLSLILFLTLAKKEKQTLVKMICFLRASVLFLTQKQLNQVFNKYKFDSPLNFIMVNSDFKRFYESFTQAKMSLLYSLELHKDSMFALKKGNE